ncbi:hypothetical protein [Myroides odoratus]|uniref:hypothetical protein n=1 Tax=Myroides odoratus TaxID=256 RepID=UPI0039B07B54
MRVLSANLLVADKLNVGKYACNLTMDYDVYSQLLEFGFKPKEFIQNNKVKILIELSEMADVDKITSNTEIKKQIELMVSDDHCDDFESKFIDTYDKYLSDLLEFTNIEIFIERDFTVKLTHKETGSSGSYRTIGKRLEEMIVDFYCFVKKISWYEFMELFTQFRLGSELEKEIRLIKIRTGRSGSFMDRLLEMAKIKPIRTQSELDNERLTEIVDAIVRHRKSEMAVPTEWIQEYNTIIERIKNNPK